ncbi:MAG: hypothetical protein F6K61_21510 [Sphaerospermopsis sp. SIO1G1]|nr:hypothetical protein [Sphaerospermopsis sp. SIO1G1]
MQTRKDDAATPYNQQQDDGSFIGEPGLTKRETFAAIALHGILTEGHYLQAHDSAVAVKLADSLIAELNKREAEESIEKPTNIEKEEWNEES